MVGMGCTFYGDPGGYAASLLGLQDDAFLAQRLSLTLLYWLKAAQLL